MRPLTNGDDRSALGEFGDISGLVRVVRGGDVDEEELAALVAGIVAARLAAGDEVDDGSRTSIWADPRRRWGVSAQPSRAAWRWSTHQAW